MRLQQFLLLACICLVFTTCKKDEGTTTNDTVDKLATVLTMQDGAAETYADTFFATHDSVRAINAAGQWLLTQPEVSEVYYWNASLLDIHFVNGLQSSLLVTKADADGQTAYRGGGTGSGIVSFKGAPFTGKREKIRNNKVLVLNPFEEDFNINGIYNKAALFEGGEEDLDVKIVNRGAVTYQVLNTMGDYGFIIINSHGTPGTFLLLKFLGIPPGEHTKWTRADIMDKLLATGIPLEKFGGNELLLDMRLQIDDHKQLWFKDAAFAVTEKYIRNAPFSLDGAVLFGNHCYSGYTANGTVWNLPDAYHSKGAAAYYGYAYLDNTSGAVFNHIANAMEDSLIISLVKDGDTTGIAHLKDNTTIQTYPGAERSEIYPVLANRNGLMFQPTGLPSQDIEPLRFLLFYAENYGYGGCGDTITDDRDQQKYPTVCIGEQVWLAKNLNYAGAGVCFNNSNSYCNTYGHLYTWTEMTNDSASDANPSGIKGICPKGWHVPSLAEWQELINIAGGEFVAGNKLRSTSSLWDGGAPTTDEYGFGALPAGECSNDEFTGEYDCFNDESEAIFWTTTTVVRAQSIDMDGTGYTGTFDRPLDAHFSCRCVKD